MLQECPDYCLKNALNLPKFAIERFQESSNLLLFTLAVYYFCISVRTEGYRTFFFLTWIFSFSENMLRIFNPG